VTSNERSHAARVSSHAALFFLPFFRPVREHARIRVSVIRSDDDRIQFAGARYGSIFIHREIKPRRGCPDAVRLFSARDRSLESRIDISRRDTPCRACNADRSLTLALNGIILQRRARGIDEAARKHFDTTAGLRVSRIDSGKPHLRRVNRAIP